jgi:hypothetical protein
LTASAIDATPSRSLSQEMRTEGPAAEPSDAPARSATSGVTTAMPMTQPTMKPLLAARACVAKSIRITAMIGAGLIATPSASGNSSPMT